ncbi:GNAT family N-acetyltransferase [Pseudonocardia sp. HH130630-07]|uniref:GNAT family N-acetyltransferase n=1 Tax=Pseudonocardia sp. HH130630-07 TaxID=1690815 RepID=UPI0008153AD4|nr:GNAT family N-acetyltransferase [Pseudonocardia sp. HH130630-07]ANY05505.1 GNAT family acetyltransferase [Pseudonocardia sp. HH130630-07]
MSDTEQPVVTHDPVRRRYEIALGGERVGLAAYTEDGDRRIFHHTEVDPALRGRGLASTLVGFALTDTRDAGWRIVPQCPYVQHWIASHEGFADRVEESA